MILGVLLLVLVVVLVMRARRRKAMHAGLLSERPMFTVTPPTRWSTSGKDHRL